MLEPQCETACPSLPDVEHPISRSPRMKKSVFLTLSLTLFTTLAIAGGNDA